MARSQIDSEDRKIGKMVSPHDQEYELFLCPDGEEFKYRLKDGRVFRHDLDGLPGFSSWFRDGMKKFMRQAADPSVSPNSRIP